MPGPIVKAVTSAINLFQHNDCWRSFLSHRILQSAFYTSTPTDFYKYLDTEEMNRRISKEKRLRYTISEAR